MRNWKIKTAGIAALALSALALTTAPAAAQRDGSSLVFQQVNPNVGIAGPAINRNLQPQRDVWHALGCQEVGNGDVATTVRLSNIYIVDTVPAGNVVSVYGSDGQHVSDHVMPYALPPGAYVDVQVVPWQAVYQGCVAMTGL